MTTLTLETIATQLNISVEDVCVRTATTYARHLVIKGVSYCGRINNDGYSMETQFDAFVGYTCGTCEKRHAAKVAKVAA